MLICLWVKLSTFSGRTRIDKLFQIYVGSARKKFHMHNIRFKFNIFCHRITHCYVDFTFIIYLHCELMLIAENRWFCIINVIKFTPIVIVLISKIKLFILLNLKIDMTHNMPVILFSLFPLQIGNEPSYENFVNTRRFSIKLTLLRKRFWAIFEIVENGTYYIFLQSQIVFYCP